ncbi:MAG: twin-arginine translocase TatA/TatE family subunit [Chloroflexi bacterium]|nr:twin-arginine translocase TatA/TatE family subunit [Chloroflexota bacterium]
MPFNLGGPEMLIILVVVLIVFGAGKLPDVFGQLGRGVRSFRDESTGENKSVAATPTGGTMTASGAKFCAKCGSGLSDGAKFCPSCGTPTAS